jgi:hypothetical protein
VRALCLDCPSHAAHDARTADPFPLAWTRIDDYLPRALQAIGQGHAPPFNGVYGALSPIAFPRVDWYAAIPAECFTVTMSSMKAKGYVL